MNTKQTSVLIVLSPSSRDKEKGKESDPSVLEQQHKMWGKAETAREDVCYGLDYVLAEEERRC